MTIYVSQPIHLGRSTENFWIFICCLQEAGVWIVMLYTCLHTHGFSVRLKKNFLRKRGRLRQLDANIYGTSTSSLTFIACMVRSNKRRRLTQNNKFLLLYKVVATEIEGSSSIDDDTNTCKFIKCGSYLSSDFQEKTIKRIHLTRSKPKTKRISWGGCSIHIHLPLFVLGFIWALLIQFIFCPTTIEKHREKLS